MNKTIFRFKFFNMPVSVPRSAQIGTLFILVIATALAIFTTNLTPLDALIAGILATIIYWFGDLFHQYGHFFAAKQAGKPSTGLRLWWVLGTTLYPKNEGRVSSGVHVRRAIGGPIASLILVIVILGLGSGLWSYTPMSQFLISWALFVNGALFLLGSLVPLAIGGIVTDGMILWRAWRKSL